MFYCLVEDGQIIDGPRELPRSWKNVSGIDKASDERLKEMGWLPYTESAAPEYDADTQRLSHVNIVGVNSVTKAWSVVDFSEEEFNQHQPPEDQVDLIAVKKLLAKQLETMAVPAEEINDYASLFPVFKVGEAVVADDRRQYKGVVWRVIQGHTTQMDWLPPNVPALWARVHSPDVIPLWVQPAGGHDAYQIGDKVQHPDGVIWESTAANNVWAPGVYGWQQI